MKLLVTLFVLFLFPVVLRPQGPPDSSSVLYYPDGNIHKQISIYGKGLPGELTVTSVYQLNEINLYRISTYKNNDTIYCDTVFLYPNGYMKKLKAYRANVLRYYSETNEKHITTIRGGYDAYGIRQGYWYFDSISEKRLYVNGKVLERENYKNPARTEERFYNLQGELIKTEYIDAITSENSKADFPVYYICVDENPGNVYTILSYIALQDVKKLNR